MREWRYWFVCRDVMGREVRAMVGVREGLVAAAQLSGVEGGCCGVGSAWAAAVGSVI